LDFVWLVADTLNALMALPNLVALVLLSPVVFKLTRDYFARKPAAHKPV
jgi:alanine or glycine:cation symporter, AGCS family